MKIGEFSALNKVPPATLNVERREPSGGQQTFQSKLMNLGGDKYMQRLADMGDQITLQGAIVARRADIVEMKRYREMISEFMNEAVRFMFEYKKKNTMDARGRHRIYALIKKINKKLEELTQELLEGQKDAIEILAAIDDIKGMLLDLFM